MSPLLITCTVSAVVLPVVWHICCQHNTVAALSLFNVISFINISENELLYT